MRSGLDRSTVSRLLNGDRQPTLDTAVRLIRILQDGDDAPVEVAGVVQVADPVSQVARILEDDPFIDPDQRAELIERYRLMRAG